MPVYLLMSLFVLGVCVLGGLALFRAMFFVVEQRTVAVVQRLGRFQREIGPGLHFKVPLIERVAGRLNLRVQQLDVRVETKTEDNAFVKLGLAVQYFVLPKRVYDAFYMLDDATRHVTSSVLDVVRARAPRITLNDLFRNKGEIADLVHDELTQTMGGAGYGILKVLVTDVRPSARVKSSLNKTHAVRLQRLTTVRQDDAPTPAVPLMPIARRPREEAAEGW